MLFKGFSIFSSDDHFVQRSGTILAILVKELHRPIGLGEDVVLRVFLFLALAAILFSIAEEEHSCEIILKSTHRPRRRCRLKGFSIFSFDGHFVQRSGTILAILVEGHPRNISMKLF